MSSFERELIPVTYRVAGIAIHEEHIFMQWSEGIWVPPSCEVGSEEPSREVLKHEMKQLLGEEAISVGSMLWVLQDGMLAEQTEVDLCTFYFAITLPHTMHVHMKDVLMMRTNQSGERLVFGWLPLNRLDTIHMKPQWLRSELALLSGVGVL